jgi:hypothetical protein
MDTNSKFRNATNLILLVAATTASSPGKTINVDCQKPGMTLEKAVQLASPGDVIRVEGICTGKVTVTTSHITLDGGGTAVIRGPGQQFRVYDSLISISGAQGVTITGLTVENGAAEAIGVEKGAAAVLSNVRLRGSTIGLLVATSSTVELRDAEIRANFVGVDMVTGSSLVLKGRIVVRENLSNGFDVIGNSTLEVLGAQVESINNGGSGITMTGGELLLLAYPPAQGSSITASGNARAGMTLSQSSVQFSGDPAANRLTLTRNGTSGIRALLGTQILSAAGAISMTIEDNPVGITLESNSGAWLNGGLMIRNNGTGIVADGAGVLVLATIPQAPSSITGNTTRDIDARFGSRIRVVNVPIGVVACDGTVLSQGLACP